VAFLLSESFMGNGVIALVIAAVLAALATVLFRSSPRREETDRSSPAEQVLIPAAPPVEPPVDPVSSSFPEASEPNLDGHPVDADADDGPFAVDPTINPPEGSEGFAATPIVDPWAPETPGGEASPPLDESVLLLDVNQADPTTPFPLSDGTPEGEHPVEIVLDDPNASFAMNAIGTEAGAADPLSSTSPGMDLRFTRGGGNEEAPVQIPLVPLQDPSRPGTSELADLSQDILEWGDTQDLGQLDRLLAYATHPDGTIRSCVALAVGKVVRGHVTNPTIAPAISALGTLSQDSDSKVSLLAVQALAALQSPQARPYLEQARLHASAKVINAANMGLQNLA
jgi:hypothetical protein